MRSKSLSLKWSIPLIRMVGEIPSTSAASRIICGVTCHHWQAVPRLAIDGKVAYMIQLSQVRQN